MVDLDATRIEQNDSVEEYLPKVFDRTIAYLLNLRSSIDKKVIASAVRIIRHARRIEFIAQGASAGVAIELMQQCITEKRAQGVGIILIEQNLNMLKQSCDHLWGIESGHLRYSTSITAADAQTITAILSV